MRYPEIPDKLIALEEETLDRDDLPMADTRRALRDLQRVNLWLFGRRSLRATLIPLLLVDRERTQTILDVAAGAGDSTAAMTRSAARRSIETTVVSESWMSRSSPSSPQDGTRLSSTACALKPPNPITANTTRIE